MLSGPRCCCCPQVAKSPSCANEALEYRITPAGLEEVEGSPIPEALRGQDVMSMTIGNEVEYGM